MSVETIYSSSTEQDTTAARERLVAACATDAVLPVAARRQRLARASAPSPRLMATLAARGF